jgi:outer membrane receptor protein involved in Fe transport
MPICVGYDHKYGTISVFVRNLFDERYLTSISPGYGEAAIGDRRMIGIRATGRL